MIMRKETMKIIHKSLIIISSAWFLAACADSQPDLPSEPLVVNIAGAIDHTVFTKDQSGTVIFNRFPVSVGEFKKIQEQIGGEPHGAVALELMAAEMYRRNTKIGTECLTLCNTTVNVNIQTDRWKELFGKDINYARPYQIGAFLKGATPENNYTPSEPYTIEVKVNNGRPYQNITDYQSVELYLEVLTKGKDHGSETVYVVKPNPCNSYPDGSRFFLVNNCPGLYAQVKEIYEPGWNKLK